MTRHIADECFDCPKKGLCEPRDETGGACDPAEGEWPPDGESLTNPEISSKTLLVVVAAAAALCASAARVRPGAGIVRGAVTSRPGLQCQFNKAVSESAGGPPRAEEQQQRC